MWQFFKICKFSPWKLTILPKISSFSKFYFRYLKNCRNMCGLWDSTETAYTGCFCVPVFSLPNGQCPSSGQRSPESRSSGQELWWNLKLPLLRRPPEPPAELPWPPAAILKPSTPSASAPLLPYWALSEQIVMIEPQHKHSQPGPHHQVHVSRELFPVPTVKHLQIMELLLLRGSVRKHWFTLN